MSRRIAAHRHPCLRSLDQPINPFEILIGSNASGKPTFLDVVAFLGDLVSAGLETAVDKRSANFHDLLWGRAGDTFERAVEATTPEHRRVEAPLQGSACTIRYRVGIRIDTLPEKLHIEKELGNLEGCKCPAFQKLRATLRRWFPAATALPQE